MLQSDRKKCASVYAFLRCFQFEVNNNNRKKSSRNSEKRL